MKSVSGLEMKCVVDPIIWFYSDGANNLSGGACVVPRKYIRQAARKSKITLILLFGAVGKGAKKK